MYKDFKISVPDSIAKVVKTSNAEANYKRNGDVSSFEVELTLSEIALHKVCKSSDLGILKNKIEKTLEDWEIKYEKYLKQKALANTEAKAQELNDDLKKTKSSFDNILKHTLKIDDAIDWDSLKSKKEFKVDPSETCEDSSFIKHLTFSSNGEPTGHTKLEPTKEPDYEEFFKSSGWFFRTFRKKTLKSDFDEELKRWNDQFEEVKKCNQERLDVFKRTLEKFEKLRSRYIEERNEKNKAVDLAKTKYENGDQDAIEEYCDMVLSNSIYPEVLNMSWQVSYNPENQSLVIDYEVPSPDDLPLIDSYKFVKSKNDIEKKPLSASNAKALYSSVLYQVCIRTIHEVLEADVIDKVSAVAFNGVVTSLNEGTGNIEEKVIMSIFTSKEEFLKVNLEAIVAEKTFNHLDGIAGKHLYDLSAVTPIAVFEKAKAAS
jgi:restriction system protein